jgi:hypothetical protein
MTKAGMAEPRTFSSTPRGVAPPGSNPGWARTLGTDTSAVFVTDTSTKKLAIGCLAIHDRSDDTSVPAACSAQPRFATSSILGFAWKQQAPRFGRVLVALAGKL